ncbi:uracil phosphoribosyltransferase [Candidatus Saccharibacteria bacterium]|nr:uracil phosphoribosyltransferase [Candidatus Saccharibacteria bacterium]
MKIIPVGGYKNAFVFGPHPLILHKLTILRDKTTNKKDCRELVHELTLFLMAEATYALEVEDVTVQTPVAECVGKRLSSKADPVIFPIWRAGDGMKDAALQMLPTANLGAIGMYRNEESKPVDYFHKPEEMPPGIVDVFILDPMLATGGSAAAAVTLIKKSSTSKLNIRFLSIFAAPQGIKCLSGEHPDITIYTCVVDEGLNDHNYIVPGCGDMGDRLYGTK